MKKILIILIGILILGTFTFVYTYKPEQKIKELTLEQADILIRNGLMQVYYDLPNHESDKDTQLIYLTSQGNCYLYKDIFGRYYCRW